MVGFDDRGAKPDTGNAAANATEAAREPWEDWTAFSNPAELTTRLSEPAKRAHAERVVTTLSETYQASSGQMTCPQGFRDELVEVLNRCVVNQSFLNIYMEVVHNAREQGLLPPKVFEGFPEETLRKHGFSHLNTQTLVNIACDPNLVQLAADFVNCVGDFHDEDMDQTGRWAEEAFLKEYM